MGHKNSCHRMRFRDLQELKLTSMESMIHLSTSMESMIHLSTSMESMILLSKSMELMTSLSTLMELMISLSASMALMTSLSTSMVQRYHCRHQWCDAINVDTNGIILPFLWTTMLQCNHEARSQVQGTRRNLICGVNPYQVKVQFRHNSRSPRQLAKDALLL